MSVTAETIHTQLRYTAWASGRLVDAVAKLSDEELHRDFKHADKNVLGTLVHIFAADRVWLGRIQGNVPVRFIDPETDLRIETLQNDWPALQAQWQLWAGSLDDDAVNEPCTYKDLKGNGYSTPLWQIVLHVVNHGSQHRGQVSAMLRAMGHPPPPLDMIHFYRLPK